jgi:hypothetical protein
LNWRHYVDVEPSPVADEPPRSGRVESPPSWRRSAISLLAVASVPVALLAVGVLLGSGGQLTLLFIGVAMLLVALLVWYLAASALDVEALSHPSAWRRRASEVAFYAVVVGLWFRPIWNLTDFTFGTAGDSQGWVWTFWVYGQEVSWSRPFPTTSALGSAPYGLDFMLYDGQLGLVLGGYLNTVFGPVTSYNVVLITAFCLTLWAARRLCRRLVTDPVAVALLAAASATAPSLFLRYLGHSNLVFSFVAFMVVDECVRIVARREPDQPLATFSMTITLALAFLSSIYFFLFGSLILAVAVIINILMLRRSLKWRTLLRSTVVPSLISIVLVALVATPFVLRRVDFSQAEASAGAPASGDRFLEYTVYSADVRSVIRQPPTSAYRLPFQSMLDTGFSPNVLEATIFPGAAMMAGLLFLPLTADRRRRLFIGAAALGVWILSLGPSLVLGQDSSRPDWWPGFVARNDDGSPIYWLPYTLFQHVPILEALRAPNRAGFFLVPLGAAAMALLVKHVFDTGSSVSPRASTAVRSFLLLGLALNLTAVAHWQPDDFSISSPNSQDWARVGETAGPEELMMYAGADCLQSIPPARFQVSHGVRLFGCQTFSSAFPWYSGDPNLAASESLAALRCSPGVFGTRPAEVDPATPPPDRATFEDLRQKFGIAVYVVDTALPCADPVRLTAIEDALDRYAERVGEIGTARIYRYAD